MKQFVSFFALFLPFLAAGQEPKLMLPVGHTDIVVSAKFSPDGKKIVTASHDRTIKVWDAETFRLLLDIYAHPGGIVRYAEFSPDGRKIVSGSKDSTVRIWDSRTGELLRTIKEKSGVNSVKFNTTSTRIIAAMESAHANIRNAETGELYISLKDSNTSIMDAAFSPDDKKVVTSGNEPKVWDAGSGKLLRTLVNTGHTNSVGFSRDGSQVLTGQNKVVKAWEIQSGEEVLEIRPPGTGQEALFGPGHSIATWALDSSVSFWDSGNGKLTRTFPENAPVRNVGFSNDGRRFVAALSNGEVSVWDLERDQKMGVLRGYSRLFNTAEYINNSRLLTITDNSDVKLWESTTGNLLSRFAPFSNDKTTTATVHGKLLYAGSERGMISVYDIESRKRLHSFRAHFSFICTIRFNADGSLFVTASRDGTAKVWNTKSNQCLLEQYGHQGKLTWAEFSPDGKHFITASFDGTAKRWNLDSAINGKLYQRQAPFTYWHGAFVYSSKSSRDGIKLITASADRTAKVWDLNSGQELLKITAHPDQVFYAEFSPDGKQFLTASADKTIKLWDTETGALTANLQGHKGSVYGARFNSDASRVISFGDDNTARAWDARSGKDLYTFLSIDSTGYFYFLPSGYYMTSPDAAKLLHYVTKDLKVITFEQLDVKYNRPDLVLPALGNTDTALINAYKKAYGKRIKKLGIDTASFGAGFGLPGADFSGRENIGYEQTAEQLKLRIKGSDTAYHLDRFNVWVNEVPLYGMKGVSLRTRKINAIDTVITVMLSSGKNTIETSVTNANGTESYRMPLEVSYDTTRRKPARLHFIGIGINRYADPVHDLSWSVNDIDKLAKKLRERYKDIVVDTLFDRSVTRANVIALKQRLTHLTENDKVIVAYSGHGLLSKDFDYYLSTHDIDFDKPEELGLAYDELENLLDGIRPRQKLMLIDACHSGEVDKDELQEMGKRADSLGLKGIKIIGYKKDKKMGLENSFELMQNLFVNVSRGTGATVISAAGGTQFALERGDLENGVFTYSILDAFAKHERLTVTQLKRIVSENVLRLTRGMQKPTSRNETNSYDWQVW